jgi:hypothetical protein
LAAALQARIDRAAAKQEAAGKAADKTKDRDYDLSK